MKYSVSAFLCILSFMMYTFVEMAENIISKAIYAYLIANKASFADDQFLLNFYLVKVVFLCFTVVFGVLAIYSIFEEKRKK